MKLYWAPRTRAFRIAWLLEESGLPYERVRIDIADPASRADPAFRAVSPLGKVPALLDEGSALSDSGAIALWLAERHPECGLAPPVGDAKRAAFLQWALFSNAMLEPAMVERSQKFEPRPASHGYGSWELVLGRLREGIAGSGGDWILGERFSAADALVGTGTYWLIQFGMVKDEPILAGYAARCEARPAFQRVLAFEA
jgi:glutathione S-transferase